MATLGHGKPERMVPSDQRGRDGEDTIHLGPMVTILCEADERSWGYAAARIDIHPPNLCRVRLNLLTIPPSPQYSSRPRLSRFSSMTRSAWRVSKGAVDGGSSTIARRNPVLRVPRALIIAVSLCIGPPAAAQQQSPSSGANSTPANNWYVEYSLNGGTVTTTNDISIRSNATGSHELLHGRLKSSLFVGGKVGAHGNRFGLEAGVFRTAEKIQVSNDVGVPFPNHGENVTLLKADVVLYPVRRTAFGGVFRPYLSAGFGGTFFSLDTDNINDQENYAKPTLSIGAGGKYKLGGEGGKRRVRGFNPLRANAAERANSECRIRDGVCRFCLHSVRQAVNTCSSAPRWVGHLEAPRPVTSAS